MKPRIIQLSAGFNPGDAISNEIKILHKIFQTPPWSELFRSSYIFAEFISPESNFPVRHINKYNPRHGDVLLYHFSIASKVTPVFLKSKGVRILKYHNTTPSHFFRPYNLSMTIRLIQAKKELLKLRDASLLSLADSHFNSLELKKAGFVNVQIAPLFNEVFHKKKGRGIKLQTQKGDTLLFVGRLAPNKGHLDLLKIFYFVKKALPNTRLVLVGGNIPGMNLYNKEILKLINTLNLNDSVRFTGFIDDLELERHYLQADLFLSASKHEGFCAPLVEAMFYGVPILAYINSDSAVNETLGNGGVKFSEMNYPLVAEMAVRLLRDKSLRKAIIKKQKERLQRIDPYSSFVKIYPYFSKLVKEGSL